MDRRAYSEVNYIINEMPEDMKNKIPQDIIINIQNKMDKQYIIQFKDIEYDELLPDTERLLAVLYADYIAPEEERRLCYVAITRAKEKLYLLNARRRVLFGEDSINPPSRFISEIDESLIDSNTKKTEEVKHINKEDVIRDEDVDYQVGDYVVHEHFGAGKVVDVTNSLVSVAFSHPYGIKKLMKNHKSLTKV